MFDDEMFLSEYLQIAYLKNFIPISINSNSMKEIEINTNAVLYLEKMNSNFENSFKYCFPFLCILSTKIDGKIYSENVNVSIIIEYIK